MKTVILCGGLGTRLREETEYKPKPMVDIGGRPILWHIMKIYAACSYRDFVLCLGYKGDVVKQYFLQYDAMNNDFTISLGENARLSLAATHDEQDYTVTLSDTGLSTMTGGRLRRVRRYVGGETFMLTYGDGVADIDIEALVRFHKSHGRLATMTTVRPVSRFGIVDLKGNAVERFVEKPQLDAWVSAGFFVFEPGVFDYLSEGDDCVLEREPLERLARDGQLMAYRHDGFFFAMDTYREYQYLNGLWDSGTAPWQVWKRT